MKSIYDGIAFDSDLEVEYYKTLKTWAFKGVIRKFLYHPTTKLQLTQNNKYTPDFIVEYPDYIEIVETKGYNQFSFQKDNMTHNLMLAKPESELKAFVKDNGFFNDKKVVYKKIKYLKAYGFVDWDFKNPNTLANKRKEKNVELAAELKQVKKELADYKRYYNYMETSKKLTKAQSLWLQNFLIEHRGE